MVAVERVRVEPRCRRVGGALVLAGLLVACGSDDGERPFEPMDRDAGPFDAGPPPDRFPLPVDDSDAAVDPDGEPPPELAGAPCAVDTNKLYELVRRGELPDASELAVEPIESRFGVAFIGKGTVCLDALFVAEVQGRLSEPEVATAVDECSSIEQPSVAASEGGWLFAFVDNRAGGRNVWVQAFDPRMDTQPPAYPITDNTRTKSEVKIVGLGPDGALVAWVERDSAIAANQFMPDESLKVRPLWPDGEPYAEEVVIGESLSNPTERTSFASVRLARIGASGAALGYRRNYRRFEGAPCFDDTGCSDVDTCACDPSEPNPSGYCYCRPDPDDPSVPCEPTGRCEGLDGTPRLDVTVEERAELMLEVLDLDGNPVKTPFVLTDKAGTIGTLALATDEEGGAVIYTIAQGMYGRQVWFQKLDDRGEPPPAMVGGLVTGTEDPMLIISPPTRPFDASVTKLATGFAIAYRALPAEDASPMDGEPDYMNDTPSPRIRVHFTERFGRTVEESDVALSEPTGGLTSIESALDGRIMLAWRDLHEDGTTSLTAARLPCVGEP